MNRVSEVLLSLALALLSAAPACHILAGDESKSTEVSGLVTALAVPVQAPSNGIIQRVLVRQGDRVQAGQLLAVIESPEIDAKISAGEKRFSSLLAGLEAARQAEKRAKQGLEVRKSGARSRLAMLESQKADADKRLQELRVTYPEARTNLQAGMMVRKTREPSAEMALDLAQTRVAIVDERILAARQEVDFLDTQVSPEAIAAEATRAELLVSEQRAALDELHSLRDHLELKAPRAATIAAQPLPAGQIVRAGEPLLILYDASEITVNFYVEEGAVSASWTGKTMSVHTPSGEELRGVITSIAPEAGFATQRDVSRSRRDIRTIGIRVRLENANGRVHPGAMVSGKLPPGEPPPS